MMNANSVLTVNLTTIKNNYLAVKASLPKGTEVIPVLKCNAYGMGAVPVAKALCQVADIRHIALAQVREAAQLRAAGVTAPQLLITGGVPAGLVGQAVALDAQLTVFDAEGARQVSRAAAEAGKAEAKVQIKIETGLGRIGAKPGAPLQQLAREIKKLPNVTVAGVFTHFADAETEGSPLALRQLALFKQGVAQLEEEGIHPPMRHIAASAATEWMPQATLDAVRIGRRLYMDAPLLPDAPKPTGRTQQACSWHSSVIALHDIQAGQSLGYGQRFTAQKPMQVAVICVGYGDGLVPGVARGAAPVLVGGKQAKLIGLCMDQCFADVTGLGCRAGDEVTFFGWAQNGAFLPAQQVAATVEDEGVFLTSMLSNRVERVYSE